MGHPVVTYLFYFLNSIYPLEADLVDLSNVHDTINVACLKNISVSVAFAVLRKACSQAKDTCSGVVLCMSRGHTNR